MSATVTAGYVHAHFFKPSLFEAISILPALLHIKKRVLGALFRDLGIHRTVEGTVLDQSMLWLQLRTLSKNT